MQSITVQDHTGRNNTNLKSQVLLRKDPDGDEMDDGDECSHWREKGIRRRVVITNKESYVLLSLQEEE